MWDWFRGRGLVVLGVVLAAVAALTGVLTATSSGAGAGAAEQSGSSGAKVVRELPELRTATSDTDLLSDGSHAQRVYSHPINFRVGRAWHPVEDRLVRAADGTWQPSASPVPISLPTSLGRGPVAVGPTGRRFAFSLEGASTAEGTATGTKRTYADALPGVSAAYVASPGSVRETLTLGSASAPTTYRYKLTLSSGLRAQLAHGGGLTITNAAGKRVYWLAAPTVTDSSTSRGFRSRSPVHYELSGDGSVLSLILDSAWLKDPKRTFPVAIDPEVYYYEDEDCAIINGDLANAQECGGPLFIGADSESPQHVARTVAHFDLSCIPTDVNVLRSRLALWEAWHVGESPLNIQAVALTHSYTDDVTWNNSGYETPWGTAGGDFEATPIGQQTVKPENELEYLSWGITPQVEHWIQEPSSNHGLLLKAENETTPTYYAFEHTDNPESNPEPFVEVIYEPRLGDPENQTLIDQPLGNGGTAGVNVVNGNLNVTNPDVRYEAEGYETELSRSYNSQDDVLPGAALHEWRLGPAEDTSLFHTAWDGSNVIIQPDGSDLRFDREPAGDGEPEAGDRAFSSHFEPSKTLVEHEDGSRALKDSESETEWDFDNDGFPEKVVDPKGEGNMLSLSYTSEELTGASDTHGHSLTMTRDPYSGYITKIESTTSEEWKYTYDENARLASYKGPEGHEAKYGYFNSDDFLKYIEDPDGTVVIAYDEANRVTSVRKLVNGSISTPGSEDQVTTFAYDPPESPICNAETDVGQTVVTRTPGEEAPTTYCYNAIGHVTGYSGPLAEAEEEATEGLEEQEEIPESTCYEDSDFPEKYCGGEDPGAENTEGESEGFAPLVTKVPPDLEPIDYGIADNNKLATFNPFTHASFKNLHVSLMRRSVPWDLVWEGTHSTSTLAVERYEELKTWVNEVKALPGGKGQPTISFDRCTGKWVNPLKAEQIECTTTPTVPQYEAAIKAFLEDATLKGVVHFSAWNEPDNTTVSGEPTAERAGKYWRALDTLCVKAKAGCQVAAGEFLDTEMPTANDKSKGGGKYFKEYVHFMGYPGKAKHWAWHAYTDGERAGTTFRGKPTEWWKRFRNFKKAINKASHGPDIWLTEQGVRYAANGKPLAAHESADTANAIMRAYVCCGPNQLTRRGQVTKFFYYEMRGDPATLDSGLLAPSTSAQRSIYGIYRSKTPKS